MSSDASPQDTSSPWWHVHDNPSSLVIAVAITIVLVVALHTVLWKNNNQKEKDEIVQEPRQLRSKFLESLQEQAKQQEEESSKENDRNDATSSSSAPLPPGRQRPAPPTTSSQTQVTRRRPPMSAKTNEMPGLRYFYPWYNVEASLYRIYVIGKTNQEQVVCPFVPRSERGRVQVELEITNHTSHDINVYWITYKGNEEFRGVLRAHGDWHQTTWIGHPWTFRNAHDDELVLHYIPYKICPSTPQANTTSDHDVNVGLYKFTITTPDAFSKDICHVVDGIFPTAFSSTHHALEWTLLQMQRYDIMTNAHSYHDVDLILKYFTNILVNPSQVKYRQVRIANPIFFREIWNTPCRGIFLVAGFQECAGYAELGSDKPLSDVWKQHLGNVVLALEQYKGKQALQMQQDQPEGALDGYGRAGFGRAGQM